MEKLLHYDLTHGEWYALFDENFFKPLPTKEELVWGDYLAMLREEWFVVFDRMAALHFKVLPQRLNKDNMVNPLFIATQEKTIAWPDPESMKKRRSMPKANEQTQNRKQFVGLDGCRSVESTDRRNGSSL
jgi:hypothetical protein